jgi:hypothetical protein
LTVSSIAACLTDCSGQAYRRKRELPRKSAPGR